MPRTKKKLIDRNAPNTFTFRLAHRSQRDPRIADPEASPYVLVPVRHVRDSRGRRVEGETVELDPDQLFAPPAAAAAAAGAAARTQGRQPAGADAAAGGSSKADELLKYGIYYDDGYDYLQHLRQASNLPEEQVVPDAASVEAVVEMVGETRRSALRSLNLPGELFPSMVEEEVGFLNRAAPNSDPLLDWDPDLVEILDREDTTSQEAPEGFAEDAEEGIELDGGLADDFVLLANSDDPAVLARIEAEAAEDEGDDSEDYSDIDEDEDASGEQQAGKTSRAEEKQWRKIGHGARLKLMEKLKAKDAQKAGRQQRDDADGQEDDDDDTIEALSRGSGDANADDFDEDGEDGDDGGLSELRSRFTEYSMTSSILPRSEHQQRQDDHFEQLYAEYDEDQIGALDDALDEDDLVGDHDIAEFKNMMKEFLKQDDWKRRFKYNAPVDAELNAKIAELTLTEEESEKPRPRQKSQGNDGDDAHSDEEEEHLVLAEYPEKQKARWDCQSVLSTCSTLYNHPTVIEEPRRPKKIVIDKRTGIPLEGLEDRRQKSAAQNGEQENSEDEDAVSEAQTDDSLFTRNKNETPEERRARKKAVKEMRRQRREDKKATKDAFKQEEKRQLKNQEQARAYKGTKVLA